MFLQVDKVAGVQQGCATVHAPVLMGSAIFGAAESLAGLAMDPGQQYAGPRPADRGGAGPAGPRSHSRG